MAYIGTHVLLRVMGHFGTIATEELEYWSYGFRIMMGTPSYEESKKLAFATDASNAVAAFHNNAQSMVASTAWWSKVTAAYIGPDGKYVGGDSQPTTEVPIAPPQDGGGGQGMPFSNALCLSLRTAIDRGRGHQGRVYIPVGTTVDASGRYSIAQITNFAGQGRILVDAINTAARAQWASGSSVAIFSKLGSGVVSPVLEVGAGRAPDTQRRRDNRLTEGHVWSDLTTTLDIKAKKASAIYDPGT